jgi:hypothetical protein
LRTEGPQQEQRSLEGTKGMKKGTGEVQFVAAVEFEGSEQGEVFWGAKSQKQKKEEDIIYCERDKGMPKGWLYDWEGVATMERQNPETRFCRTLACSSICVSSLSLIDAQKTPQAN